tara:strand:- start:912 stop:1271 length:360 start_codon:yes stop_codon:yes gene_type:complete
MGGSYSLYGRRKDNEKYVFLQDLDKQYMQVFKHNVVAYATDKKHELMKSLYIYKGQLRLGKAYVKGNFLELTFQSAAYAEEWDVSFEQVDDVPWLFRNFVSHFKPVQTDFLYMRVYRKN